MSVNTDSEWAAGEATGLKWVKLRVVGTGQDRVTVERLKKFADSGRRLDAWEEARQAA